MRFRADCKVCYKICKKLDKRTHTKFKNNTKLRTMKLETLTLNEWRAALIYFKGNCAYCGYTPFKRKERLTKEHVVPMSEGGTITKENIIPACNRCNSSKSNHNMYTWFVRQSFFSEERLSKILKYIKMMGG